MATVHFPSLENAEVIEVEFVTEQGGTRLLKLLVDSGFSGNSSIILSMELFELVRAQIPTAHVIGALHGPQQRGCVTCRIPALGFQRTLIAIITDIGPLSLPPNVSGMAGLSFLRQFSQWGAEQAEEGWHFLLSNNDK